MFTRIRLVVAAVAAASTFAFSAAEAQLRPGDPGHLTWLYSHVRASVLDAVLQQTQFNVARAQADETAMEVNAAELLAALTEAKSWTDALERTVTPGEFTPEIDASVADLAALVTSAHDNLVELLVAGDMEAIGLQLDESSDTFNRLSVDLGTLRPLLLEYL